MFPDGAGPNVAYAATTLFGLGFVLGTILGFAINERRSSLERMRTRARTDPIWGPNAFSTALSFSKSYLDFVFGPRSFSPRAFAVCITISLFTTLFILGGMLHRMMDHGISERFVGFAVLLGIVDTLALSVTRKVVDGAAGRSWRAPLVMMLLLLFLIAVVAYFAMGVAWCVYIIVTQLYAGDVLDLALLAKTLVFWLPGLLITHHADIIPATIPGAFNTIALLVVIALPAVFLSTPRISKPLFLKSLDVLLALPRWSGAAIAGVCTILGFLSTTALKP